MGEKGKMLEHNIFLQIGIAIIAATLVGYIARILRQPLIPAYVIGGILVGPFGLKLIIEYGTIKTLSEIGVALLLFVVGMELDFKRLRNIGLISSVGGTIQMLILSGLGFIIALLLGFVYVEAIYVAMMVAFSSTMVVIKLLSDKNELDTLHGRIVLGFLLMEDVFAILALSIIATIDNFTPLLLVYSILKGVGILIFTIISGKYIFPFIFKIAAKSQELLFLLSITICFFFAIGGWVLGFSIAIGSFVAGVALANLPYNLEMIGKIKPLRDFFATLFFVSLGMELRFDSIYNLLPVLILFSIFIIVVKPLITALLTSFFGYKKRTAFLSAISLAQTSEFGLIIVSLGLSLGHLKPDSMLPTLATMLAIITITFTSYLILFDNKIYAVLAPLLKFLDSLGAGKRELELMPDDHSYQMVLIGHNRIGYSILNTAKKINKSVLVVDFNPDIIRNLINNKIPCIYGDIGDSEIMDRIDFHKTETVISTVPDIQDNIRLIKKIKKEGSNTIIFVTANKVDEALELYNVGADYVILPHFLGGHHISIMLEEETMNIDNMLDRKLQHMKELQSRKELGHEHPSHHHYA